MALTKIGSIGINTGIAFAGVTTIATLNGSDSVLSVGGTVNFVSDVSIGGTVSIAGTLTYEDVTNVDAVGLITARDGIKVGSGITLSKDGDIFATGITTISENLKVGTGVTISPDGDIFATGITTVSGNVKVGTGITLSPDGDVFATGVCTATSFSGDGSNLTGISAGTALSGSTDNTVCTVTGANAIQGEAALTFDGTNFNFSRQDAGDARMYIYGGEGGDARLLLASDEGDDHIDTWEIRAQASDNNLAIYQFGGGSYNKRLTIDTDANNGDVIVNTGNLVIGTAGKGIDFSAQTATSVSGSSATSEILDHYEEGTFTPEYNAGSAGSACFASGISYNSQVGHYTKIGNVVTFQLKIDPDASGLTAKSGMLQINQLPFNCKNVSSNGGAFFVLTNAFGATDTLPNPVLVTGSNAIQFYKNNSASFAGNELPSPANYIQLAGLYFTD